MQDNKQYEVGFGNTKVYNLLDREQCKLAAEHSKIPLDVIMAIRLGMIYGGKSRKFSIDDVLPNTSTQC